MAIQELNLATKENQDKILSNFPISGGTDFTANSISTNALMTNVGQKIQVNGSGMAHIILDNWEDGTRKVTLKLTIDGNIVFNKEVEIGANTLLVYGAFGEIGAPATRAEWGRCDSEAFIPPIGGTGFKDSFELEIMSTTDRYLYVHTHMKLF